MAEITTVSGRIVPELLGFTSMHEHTVCDMSVFRRRYAGALPQVPPIPPEQPIRLDNLALLRHAFVLSRDTMDLRDEELVRAEVAEFAASGGRAMVDMSTPGIRGDLAAVRRVSERTGVHIVATTGLYSEDSWPLSCREMTVQGFEALMHREIEQGIDDTGIRAGHIKVAITDRTFPGVEPFSERQKKLLRAAVRVSNDTGRSLTVHPPLDDPSSVRDVVGLMQTEGIDPARAVIAHGDLFFAPRDLGVLVLDATSWRLSVDLAMEILDRGLCISVDSFGHYQDAEPLGVVATTDWQRLAGLVALLRAGYARQIVLGTDVFLKILTRRHGGEGYSRLTTFVIPALRRLGIAEEQIRAMTVDNPARILAW